MRLILWFLRATLELSGAAATTIPLRAIMGRKKTHFAASIGAVVLLAPHVSWTQTADSTIPQFSTGYVISAIYQPQQHDELITQTLQASTAQERAVFFDAVIDCLSRGARVISTQAPDVAGLSVGLREDMLSDFGARIMLKFALTEVAAHLRARADGDNVRYSDTALYPWAMQNVTPAPVCEWLGQAGVEACALGAKVQREAYHLQVLDHLTSTCP